MSLGKSHRKAGIITIIIIWFIVIIGHKWNSNIFWFGIGCLCAVLFLSPDLDISKSLPSKAWGPLKILWLPYRMLFKHRGVSHMIIVGTITRLLYVLLIILFFLFMIKVLFHQELDIVCLVEINMRQILFVVFGVFIADILHLAMDAKKG